MCIRDRFAALVSGPGNSGLPLAAFDDSNFEMRTRNRQDVYKRQVHFQIRLAKSAVVSEGLGLADNDVRDKIIAVLSVCNNTPKTPILLEAEKTIEKQPDSALNYLGRVNSDLDRKSTRLNSSHRSLSRMPSSA